MPSSIVLWLLTACGEPPAPPLASPIDPAVAEEDLRIALDAWRSRPDPDRRASVVAAHDRATALHPPPPGLDLLLADAEANVLLDPGPALERYARSGDAARRDDIDAWMDAALRSGDLRAVGSLHERWLSAPLDLEHPLAAEIAAEATVDPNVHWQDAEAAVLAARLFDAVRDLPQHPWRGDPAPLPVLLEALGYATFEPVTAVIAEADPAEDRRVLSPGHALVDAAIRARDPAVLRRPGVTAELTAKGPLMVGVSAGRSAPLGVWTDGARIVATSDVDRLAVWVSVATQLASDRLAMRAFDRDATILAAEAGFLGPVSSVTAPPSP